MSWLGPIPIITTLAQHMDPQEEYVMITDAEEHMKLKAAARQKTTEETRNMLRTLSRQLEQAKLGATRPANVPAESEHVALINELEDSRMSLGKAIVDAEGLLASKEVELLRLREEERALESKDASVDHNLDSTALRLQICRSLGFEPILDSNNNIVRILVRSETKDIYPVTFEKNKSDMEYTQLLWDLAS